MRHRFLAECRRRRAVTCLISCACGFGVAGGEPCSLCFLELLFALSVPKLGQKRLISFVEFCIDLLEVFCRLAVHLGLTLGVGVACRQRDERNDQQRETKYVLFHFVFCIESAVTGRKKLCTLPERLLRLTMSSHAAKRSAWNDSLYLTEVIVFAGYQPAFEPAF